MEEKKQDEKLNSVLSEAEEAENNVEAKLAMDEELPEAAAEAEAVLDAAEEEKPLDKNVKLMSPMRMVMRRFFRSKLSIAGIVMLAALFLFCWLGPVVYHKWGETETDRTGANDYGTPQIVYVKNDEGEVVGSFVQIIVTEKGINALAKPSADHLLGTDESALFFSLFRYAIRYTPPVSHFPSFSAAAPTYSAAAIAV